MRVAGSKQLEPLASGFAAAPARARAHQLGQAEEYRKMQTGSRPALPFPDPNTSPFKSHGHACSVIAVDSRHGRRRKWQPPE